MGKIGQAGNLSDTVGRSRPGSETRTSDVDGVGAVEYGLDADVGRPGRCQQLDFPGLNHLISSIL